MGERVRPRSTTTMWAETSTPNARVPPGQLGTQGYKLTDINSASVHQLRSLSGIGVFYSGKIVEGRPYRRTEELLTKHVVPPFTYHRMKDQIVAKNG